MKKIVVVEDRPWLTMDATVELQKKEVVFYRTVYYPSVLLNSKERERLMTEYMEKTGIEVITVHEQREFIDRLEELYADEELIFMMDYDLKGDMAVDDFFSRVNIKYALEKQKSEKEKKKEERIWFYTTGGADVKRALFGAFEDRIIRTPKYINSQLQWDEEEILKIVRD